MVHGLDAQSRMSSCEGRTGENEVAGMCSTYDLDPVGAGSQQYGALAAAQPGPVCLPSTPAVPYVAHGDLSQHHVTSDVPLGLLLAVDFRRTDGYGGTGGWWRGMAAERDLLPLPGPRPPDRMAERYEGYVEPWEGSAERRQIPVTTCEVYSQRQHVRSQHGGMAGGADGLPRQELPVEVAMGYGSTERVAGAGAGPSLRDVALTSGCHTGHENGGAHSPIGEGSVSFDSALPPSGTPSVTRRVTAPIVPAQHRAICNGRTEVDYMTGDWSEPIALSDSGACAGPQLCPTVRADVMSTAVQRGGAWSVDGVVVDSFGPQLARPPDNLVMYGSVSGGQQRCAVTVEGNAECSALLALAGGPSASRGIATVACSDRRQTLGSGVGPRAVMSPGQGGGVENHAAQGGYCQARLFHGQSSSATAGHDGADRGGMVEIVDSEVDSLSTVPRGQAQGSHDVRETYRPTKRRRCASRYASRASPPLVLIDDAKASGGSPAIDLTRPQASSVEALLVSNARQSEAIVDLSRPSAPSPSEVVEIDSSGDDDDDNNDDDVEGGEGLDEDGEWPVLPPETDSDQIVRQLPDLPAHDDVPAMLDWLGVALAARVPGGIWLQQHLDLMVDACKRLLNNSLTAQPTGEVNDEVINAVGEGLARINVWPQLLLESTHLATKFAQCSNGATPTEELVRWLNKTLGGRSKESISVVTLPLHKPPQTVGGQYQMGHWVFALFTRRQAEVWDTLHEAALFSQQAQLADGLLREFFGWPVVIDAATVQHRLPPKQPDLLNCGLMECIFQVFILVLGASGVLTDHVDEIPIPAFPVSPKHLCLYRMLLLRALMTGALFDRVSLSVGIDPLLVSPAERLTVQGRQLQTELCSIFYRHKPPGPLIRRLMQLLSYGDSGRVCFMPDGKWIGGLSGKLANRQDALPSMEHYDWICAPTRLKVDKNKKNYAWLLVRIWVGLCSDGSKAEASPDHAPRISIFGPRANSIQGQKLWEKVRGFLAFRGYVAIRRELQVDSLHRDCSDAVPVLVRALAIRREPSAVYVPQPRLATRKELMATQVSLAHLFLNNAHMTVDS